MKYFLIYFIITTSTFSQSILHGALLDTLPPFKIGNMWLFDMSTGGSSGYIQYKITKEIVDTDSANNFIVKVRRYENNQIVGDTTEYWIWQDSAYSESSSVFYTEGSILYRIGLENYLINGGNYTEEYINITDTIFGIITEGSIFDYDATYTPSYTYGYGTKFGLKVGLYEYHSYWTAEGGQHGWTDGELSGIKINGIIYGDSTHLTGISDPFRVSNSFELLQNFPNPFNPVTTIRFSIPREGIVKLNIYDCIGRKVQSLVDQFFNSGSYQFSFNGEGLSSGIYFYRLELGKYSLTKQMLLLK